MSKWRYLVLLLLFAAIPVALLTAVMVQTYLTGERSAMDASLQQSADATGRVVGRELAGQVQLLSVLAESPRLDIPLQKAAFEELAERLRQRLPVWSSVRVSDTDGKLLATAPAADAERLVKVVDRASFDQVVRSAQPAIGPMVLGPRGKLGFAVRVPVARNGPIAYVLSVVLRPELLSDTLASGAFPKTWEAWIVSENDQISAAAAPVAGTPTPAPIATNAPTSAAMPWGSALRVTSAAVPGTQWRVYLGMPLATFEAPTAAAIRWMVLAGLLALALVGIAAVLLRREMQARATQEAEVANWQRLDALAKLSGGVAHDFNNMLMGIQSGVDQLARRRSDDAKFAMVSAMMLDVVERGKATTQRLLSFSSRSETGAELVSLPRQFEHLLPSLHQSVRDDVSIALDIAPDVWPVQVDPTALEVAMINLCSNAADAMPAGGTIKITVANAAGGAAGKGQGAGSQVLLSVADNGNGISPDQLNRVFDPFFTTKGGRASGLGLSQVYGFAKRSGGTVTVSSVPGAGSVFSILLPRAAIPASSDHQPGADVALSGQSVLVVDDTAEVGAAVAAMLELEGVQAFVARSADDGLRLLREHGDITLAISDITMPGKSGFEFAREALQRRPGLGLVLMTGYSSQLEAGARTPFQVLSKPFDRPTLVAALQMALHRQAAPSNVVELKIRGR